MPKCLKTFPPPPCPNEVAGGGFCDEHKPVIQNRTTFEIPAGGGDLDLPTGSGGGGWGPGTLDSPSSDPPDSGSGGGYGGGRFGGGGGPI